MLPQRPWTILRTLRGSTYLCSSVAHPNLSVPPSRVPWPPRPPHTSQRPRPFSQSTLAFENRLRTETESTENTLDAFSSVTSSEAPRSLDEPTSIPAKPIRSRSKRRDSKRTPNDTSKPTTTLSSTPYDSTATSSSSPRTHHSPQPAAQPTPKKPEPWQVQKAALDRKLAGAAWTPRKRLSPEALDGIRALHSADPERHSTAALAAQFAVSPDAVRRILRSRWRPSEEEQEERLKRWDRRGKAIWEARAEMGAKPPRRWRVMGVGRAAKGEVPRWKRRAGLGHKGGAGGAAQTGYRDEDVPWEDEVAGSAGLHGAEETQQRATIGDRIV